MVFADGSLGEADLVVAELALEGAGRVEAGDVDYVFHDILFAHIDGQVVGPDHVALGEDNGALDDVFEFADISWP